MSTVFRLSFNTVPFYSCTEATAFLQLSVLLTPPYFPRLFGSLHPFASL